MGVALGQRADILGGRGGDLVLERILEDAAVLALCLISIRSKLGRLLMVISEASGTYSLEYSRCRVFPYRMINPW